MRTVFFFVLATIFSINTFSQGISGKWVSISATDTIIETNIVGIRNMVKRTIPAPDSTIASHFTRKYILVINKKMRSLTGTSYFKSPEMALDIRSDLGGTVDPLAHTMIIADENMYFSSSSGEGVAKRVPDYNYSYMDDRQTQAPIRPWSNTNKYKWSYSADGMDEYLTLEMDAVFGTSFFAKKIVFKRAKKVGKKETKKPTSNSSVTTVVDSILIHSVTQRTNKIFQEIIADTDSVRVDLYDVGEIDGDSVSLFLNNKLIASHQTLKANAISFMLKLDRNIAENKLILFAENLGSIPPNTSFMVITVNKKEYRINMQSDERTNGEIVFRFIAK